MKKPSTLLRSLSSKIQPWLSPPPVAPWPPVRSTFDRWLTAELDELHRPECCMSAAWHLNALDVAAAAQKMAAKSVATAASAHLTDADRKDIDDYLDDTVGILDACNSLRERLDAVKECANLVAAVLHCLEGSRATAGAATGRARVVLDSCERIMEWRCAEMERCGSNLRKLGEKLARCDAVGETAEALGGSAAVALLVVRALGIALSLKSRRGLPAVQGSKTVQWTSALHELSKMVKEEFDKGKKSGVAGITELRRTAAAAWSLRKLMERRVSDRELEAAVKELRRWCGELEGRVKPFEEKVGELYRQLILVRMDLLGLGLKGKTLNLYKQ